MLERSLVEKREARLDYEPQICELRDTLKNCKDKLSREVLRKEGAERNCLRLEYQLGEANRRIAGLENQEGDAPYMIVKNDCVHWKGLYREARAALDEDQFSNLNMLELPEKLQEADWSICPENTPPQVFNFVKFCKRMVKELTTDLATIKRAEMEIKFTST
ncbi:hypothetical protein KIW84_044675 [Lathyrus oleraceus]|uniref:Uncharacterized protein n=1 Tax=Pisum sativum TaxID=3888 RepID=A0A9D5AW78_PEA|nr:hypothetical protein KIW84_044675 [Pisum sativum]